MTINVNDRRKEYPGNDVATVFTGPRAFSASHIAVYSVDASNASTLLTSGYTLSGVGSANTTITMDVAPAAGTTLLILRTVPYEQACDISNQGAYLPEALEDAGLDPLAQQIQQLADTAGRALRLSDTLIGVSSVIDAVTPLAPVVVNASGTGFEVGDVTLTGDMLLRPNLADAATAGNGAALVGFQAAGTGAVPRTVLDELRARVSVEQFGAVGDGVADDTAAFKKARDYAASIGGANILLTKPKYKLTDTITVTQNHIKFIGRGHWTNHDIGAFTPATWIDWQGPAADTVFEFIPVTGAGNQRGTGGGLVDVAMIGNNIADNGLVVKSWTNGEFRIYGANFNRTIVEVGVVSTLGEARDAQFNDFWIFGRQITSPVTPSTLIIGGNNNGTNIANTSFNRFHEISTNYKNGVALDLHDSDSNWFGLVRLNSGGGTGKGVVWRGGTNVAGDNSGSARGNYFQMLSVGSGGLNAEGTNVAATAASGTIAWWDNGNGAPAPTSGTGAIVSWASSGSVLNAFASGPMAFGSDATTSAAQRGVMTTETQRIYNASSNHARYVDASNEWGLRLTGGNFTVTRFVGAGYFDVATDFRCLKAGFNGAAPVTKPAVTGSRGGNAALASLLTALASYGLITDSSTA